MSRCRCESRAEKRQPGSNPTTHSYGWRTEPAHRRWCAIGGACARLIQSSVTCPLNCLSCYKRRETKRSGRRHYCFGIAENPYQFNRKDQKRQGGNTHLAGLRPSDILSRRRRRSSGCAAYYGSFLSCSVSASFCRLRRNSISSPPEWKRRDSPESTSSIRPSSSSWLCSPGLPRHTTKAPCMTKFSLRQPRKYHVKKAWIFRGISVTQRDRTSSSTLYNLSPCCKGLK